MSVESDPVLILGGGLIGLAVAHQLARRGEMVQVLSRRRSEAAGFVAAGMLAPHAEGLSGPLLGLGQASLARIPAWVAADRSRQRPELRPAPLRDRGALCRRRAARRLPHRRLRHAPDAGWAGA